jgi:uncharacterized lipoprotein YddW (UPF0748 family)
MEKHTKFKILLVFIFLFISHLQSQDQKREFRAAWIATVINLDWPSSPFISSSAQQQELISLLDELKSDGINAVLFQVRSESDAMYNSSYDPWSYWLTGAQGTPPSPYYDPLEFVVEEAHKRGLQLHAWFNPYRVERQVGNYTTHTTHVSKENPEWIIRKGDIKILDPGIPMVRDYVTNVVMDVVNRYDVDGVHFDDYFYPYPPNQISLADDQQSWENYNSGFANRGDWRRDNVNQLVAQIYDSIQTVKPYVLFGISPFGIWKNGVPSGITGLDAYTDIYCDALAWLSAETVDYLTPQLYWPFGGGQDFGKLLPWWAQQMNGRHLMPGQALYRVSEWDADEIPNQVDLIRQTANVYGSVFFRAQNFNDNAQGVVDVLKNSYYPNKALMPSYAWKDQLVPNAAQNFSFGPVSEKGAVMFNWDRPLIADDGDSAYMYVIYRFENDNPVAEDFDNPANILDITAKNYYLPQQGSGNGYFAVSAVDRNYNEGAATPVITLSIPGEPVLAFPENNAFNQKDTVMLAWSYDEISSAYHVQVSLDSTFNTLFYNRSAIADSFCKVTNMTGKTDYFWRVSAENPAGSSAYSEIYKFNTGFPVAPLLAGPAHAIFEVPLETELKWHSTDDAQSYRIQLSTDVSFSSVLIIMDTTVTADTTLMLSNLQPNQIHFWRVAALNAFGMSQWSEKWGFKTVNVTGLENFAETPNTFYLKQNYPNPFNASTNIEFSIIENSHTSLIVFDVKGNIVEKIVDRYLNKGVYTIQFDASLLASGMYIYQIISNRQRITRKMILIK